MLYLFLIILAGTGVVSSLYQMPRQAKEQRKNREALEKFKREHPGR
jgi:hypothetical protein